MPTNFWVLIVPVLLGVIAIIRTNLYKTIVVRETQRALLLKDGKFVRMLEAGKHRMFGTGLVFDVVDMRSRSEVIGNQEITTKDGVPVKVSLIVRY